MIASLGGSLLVIVLFFTGLATLLVLAVQMESSLQNPKARHRLARVPVREAETAVAADPQAASQAA